MVLPPRHREIETIETSPDIRGRCKAATRDERSLSASCCCPFTKTEREEGGGEGASRLKRPRCSSDPEDHPRSGLLIRGSSARGYRDVNNLARLMFQDVSAANRD